jgi:hypothetical protein
MNRRFFVSTLMLLCLGCVPAAIAHATADAPESPTPASREMLISQLPGQQSPLPTANANGDFRRTSHRRWIVVDSDPNGLNCRWSSAVPQAWYSPDAQWPRRNFVQWSIVRRFPRNTVLTSNITPAGFATVMDERDLPWLKVSVGSNDRICLVRANRQYIRPIE